MSSSSPRFSDIARRVVRFYRANKRDLPWRQNTDAYRVWISEIMLQQTRVTAVIPYYQRWFTSFPTVEALANADLDVVLAHWSGLGYYSRARNIHKSAKELQQNYDGRLPRTAKGLLALPGIGRYTAGAISSIAYKQKEPLVDGNVARLLSRVFEIEESIKSTVAIKKLWELCTSMVPASAPGEFNQGLMELGALICLPKKPKCNLCPLKTCCQARQHDRTGELPVTEKRKADNEKLLIKSHAVFVLRKEALLLAHRKPKGLFGGLWELPQVTERTHFAELTNLSLSFYGDTPHMVHQQVLSHRRLHIQVWPASCTGRLRLAASDCYQKLRWHPLSDVVNLGISSATKAILQNTSKLKATYKGPMR